jgi:predicted O-methyltransferase YrrM
MKNEVFSELVFKPSFEEVVSEYQNEGNINDRVHEQFEQDTWTHELLSRHRRHVEENKLGFGDAAFHSMWGRLLEAAVKRHGRVHALEIGVFKGQVISLWALLAMTYQWPLKISCVTPLAGNPPPPSGLGHRVRMVVSKRYREQFRNGNFYDDEDYGRIIEALFRHFGLDFGNVSVHRGFSSHPAVLHRLAGEEFELVYVDGDHTFAGASHDFRVFGPKVVKGGWLVADDAGCSLPGTRFWKGHEAVSRASEILPSLGFRNVLNVGHNRVYEKIV